MNIYSPIDLGQKFDAWVLDGKLSTMGELQSSEYAHGLLPLAHQLKHTIHHEAHGHTQSIKEHRSWKTSPTALMNVIVCGHLAGKGGSLGLRWWSSV